MVYGAIDLHLRYSQVRIVTETGAIVSDRRVPTTRERLTAAFTSQGPMRILVEASTESEWVAQTLEAAGHEVVVADPNFAPMYGDLRRAVKTDGRDVAALAEANRRGWYRASYRVSGAQREQRQRLGARRQLVQMRTGTISVVRATLRQSGYRIGSGASRTVPARVARLALPAALADLLTPLLRVVEALTHEIAVLEQAITRGSGCDPVVARLQTVPGVGPIVAASFRAFVDTPTRFAGASQVSAALGLVPREASSAERQRRGHVTKVGPAAVRSVLVQAAWAHWRTIRTGRLRAWVDQIAARRGKRIAVIALARKLSRILFALWRDDTEFDRARLAA